MNYNVFCLGDSITYGLSDPIGGWCDRLKSECLSAEFSATSNTTFRIWNFGISGQTVTDLVKKDSRFKEPLSRIRENRENIFILGFGANDCAFDTEAQDFLTQKTEFKSNLKFLIDLYRDYGKCIVLGITPVTKDLEGKKDNYNCIRNNEFVAHYNNILKSVCTEYDIDFVDTYSVFTKENDLISDDGLHPNTKGHKIILEIVKKVLNNLNITTTQQKKERKLNFSPIK